MNNHKVFNSSRGSKIAYHYSAGATPTVVFFGGFMSDMEATKATALEQHCKDNNISFLRFDYSGHGKSSGKFVDGTIGMWAGEGIELVKEVVEGDIIIIGSSMGGWTGLLASLSLKERLKGFIGIAPAPDFTERLMWKNFSDEEKAELKASGKIEQPSDYSDEPYVISYGLIEDGRKHLLLDNEIALDVPIRLIHGLEDKDVPAEISNHIMDKVTSKDVEITFVKDGGHSLSEPQDIKRLLNILDQMLTGNG